MLYLLTVQQLLKQIYSSRFLPLIIALYAICLSTMSIPISVGLIILGWMAVEVFMPIMTWIPFKILNRYLKKWI